MNRSATTEPLPVRCKWNRTHLEPIHLRGPALDSGLPISDGLCEPCYEVELVTLLRSLAPARCSCGALATVRDTATDYCGVCAERRLRDVARQASARRRAAL